MATTSYTFSFPISVDTTLISSQVSSLGLAQALDHIESNSIVVGNNITGTSVSIFFANALSTQDQTTLGNLITAYSAAATAPTTATVPANTFFVTSSWFTNTNHLIVLGRLKIAS